MNQENHNYYYNYTPILIHAQLFIYYTQLPFFHELIVNLNNNKISTDAMIILGYIIPEH